MPQIKSVFSAAKEVNLIKLKPEHRMLVDDYVNQLMAIHHKAHELRSFEQTLKIINKQLRELINSLSKISVGFSPMKAYRRRNEILKIEATLTFIKECTTGNFEVNYQKKKQELLTFLSDARFANFLRPGADFLGTIHELLKKDDPSLIYLLEEHLEQGVLKEEYHKQFNQLILLLRLKASYTPEQHLPQQTDYSVLELEMKIEQERVLAQMNGQDSLGRALKYLSIACQLTTVKTTELQAAIREHGVNMQAYRHNKKCRELGGRVVLHCNQILIPGIGLENGLCYGLSYSWAEQVIKNDKFMGFRGNHEAFIQPTAADAKILQAIPSFNDFVRIDAALFKTQEAQELVRLTNYQIIITKPEQQIPEFSERVLQKARTSCSSAVFSAYYTAEGAHVVAIRTRAKSTPQGYLIDYFDANSGWMQFKDEASFKAFFIYYLKDRNSKEKIKRLALDTQSFLAGYSQIMHQLSTTPTLSQRPRANSLILNKNSQERFNTIPTKVVVSEKKDEHSIRTRRASI